MNNTDYKLDDTIAAIATPIGKGAISIIRMSGEKVVSIIKSIFTRVMRPALRSRKLFTQTGRYLGYIKFNNRIIDQVMVFFQKSPKSYTGEDLVEIHCHGNILLTNSILNLLILDGARLANPGEFTFRAFINKKVDLLRAEAINDLIHANNFLSLENAIHNLSGTLSGEVKFITDKLKHILLHLEVSIDHSDEDLKLITLREIKKILYFIKQKIKKLIGTYEFNQIYQQGITISIIGKANVGKSSLFNLLIKRDKSIISSIPGTTRDMVEEYIEINALPIKLIDTAGIKKPFNPVEQTALKKTEECIKNSHILLVMFDHSNALSKNDFNLLKLIQQYYVPKIGIINKIDLTRRINVRQLNKYLKNEKIILISVSRETGIKQLEQVIKDQLQKFNIGESSVIFNLRQKNILKNVDEYLTSALNSIEKKLYLDIVSIDIRHAINQLGLLLGKYTTDDMLKDIFSNFCIGK